MEVDKAVKHTVCGCVSVLLFFNAVAGMVPPCPSILATKVYEISEMRVRRFVPACDREDSSEL